MKKLKPCRFCGGEAELVKRELSRERSFGGFLYGVTCRSCGTQIATNGGEEQAVEYWNKRADSVIAVEMEGNR